MKANPIIGELSRQGIEVYEEIGGKRYITQAAFHRVCAMLYDNRMETAQNAKKKRSFFWK